jgi:hypothetical protein
MFYVISVKHSHKRDRYITFWRPDNRGYCFRLSRAGKYDRNTVMAHLGYYNSGCSNIAVPVEVADALTVMTTPADCLDGTDGPAVLNTAAKWRELIAAVIQPPAHVTKPAATHFGRNDPYQSEVVSNHQEMSGEQG